MEFTFNTNLIHQLPGNWVEGAVFLTRLGFLAAAIIFVCLLLKRFHQQPATRGPNSILSLIFSITLAAIFAHQTLWQLAGFRNAKFVTFMSRYSPRTIGSEASMQRGRIVDRNGLILAETLNGTRHYPLGQATAHVTGYINPQYGKTGVERADDAHLRGAALVNDPAALQRFARNLFNHSLITGHDTILTLDARLQAEAHRLMGDNRGAIVGISPRDGAILVLVSTPSFDPRDPEAALQRQDQPLFNRALAGRYPPGSTYKAMVAAIAAEYRMGGDIHCPAEGVAAEPGARPIRDHEYYAYARKNKKWQGHGTIDIRQAFARSSNVYFAKLGLLLGAQRMNEINQRFGFDRSITIFTGTDGTIESDQSSIPQLAPTDRRATAQIAIGQGAAIVTPLHMAMAAAAIANHGQLHQPYLNAANRQDTSTPALSPDAAQLVAEYMAETVRTGTGSGARIHNLPLAGKTGTAQTPSGDDHGWFIAFGPVESPQLALAVIVENSGYGSRRAVPIARDLFIAADAMGLLTPDNTNESQP